MANNIIKNEVGLYFTTNHTGKMSGMGSISTPCSCNGRCAKNAQIPGSICAACYASRMMKQYKDLEKCLKANLVLAKEIIPVEEMPVVNYAFFRIESFGDLINTTHAVNYLNLIKRNPHCFFGWWTKNPDFINNAFIKTGYEKPENTNIIRSSLLINKEVKPGYWFVDKTFTVYDKPYIKEHNVNINCGGRHCLSCLRCYMKTDEKSVREQKK